MAIVAALVVLLASSVVMATAQSAPASGWTIVTSANTSPQESNLLLGTTCTNSWNCWAVGGTIADLNNGQPVAMIEHWDGSTWSIVPSGTPSGNQVSLLWGVTCTSTANCWAVGAQEAGSDPGPVTLAEHWDGSSWSAVTTPDTHGILLSVTCTSGTNCWASGTTQTDSANSNPLNGFMDHWDGSSWSQVATAPSGQTYDSFNSVTCTSASNCWTVGFAGPNAVSFGFLPSTLPNAVGDESLIEHWDGASWTVVGAPAAGAYLSAVDCSSSSDCWTVGATMDANGNPSTTLVDFWDGTSWTTVPSPNPTTPGNLLTSVTCLDAHQCWATGATDAVTGQNQNTSPGPFVEAWDGTAWSIEPSPSVTAFGYLASVACVAGGQCVAAGFAANNVNNNFTLQTLVEQMVSPAVGNQGFWAAARDGGVFTFGDAAFHGSLGGRHLAAPIVGMAPTPDGGGYWMTAGDGGVFTFGDAAFHGSLGGRHLAAPIVGMAPTPDGGGYWLVSADGGVFTFGDAAFHGSLGGRHLDGPVVGMAPTPGGGGYWLASADGGVFTFGDAGYFGSVPGQGIARHVPVAGLLASPGGRGYWLVGGDGAVYAYGDAAFLGSLVGKRLAAPITGVALRTGS
jgi:hypothetical protein